MGPNQAQSGDTQRLNIGGSQPNVAGGNKDLLTFAIVAFAVGVAIVLGIIGIVKANGADDHAGTVGQAVVSLGAGHAELAKKVNDNQVANVNQLATKVSKTEFDAAIKTLADEQIKLTEGQTEKSIVDKLKAELSKKANKTGKYDSLEEIRGLLGVNTKAVKSLARKLKKLDVRLSAVEPEVADDASADAPAADPPATPE